MTDWLQTQWYAQRRLAPALWLLLPVAALFAALSALRRGLYRIGWLPAVRLPVPVIVVGNLVVGGTGKTPLVLALVDELVARGYRPGIISRGYGGGADAPRAVTAATSAAEVGDEPYLLAARSGVPVWIGQDRVAAGLGLLAVNPGVDVLVADDGLQHYRLARDAEVVVFDGRGAGNACQLPVGPLREPLSRLRSATALVFNGDADERVLAASQLPHFAMQLLPGDCYRLGDPQITCAPADLAGKSLHAVAGIGDPRRFFNTLRQLGLQFSAHAFPDHHPYTAADLDFGEHAVLLMTEKDAVKCLGLTVSETWVLPVTAQLPAALTETLLEKINGR